MVPRKFSANISGSRENLRGFHSAIVNVKDSAGKSIFSGREATGFSNLEEEQLGKVKVRAVSEAWCVLKLTLITGRSLPP